MIRYLCRKEREYETNNIGDYIYKKPKDRIIYIYNNYRNYSDMLRTYKASIINLMEVSAEFSRHHKSGDSDIKVQTNAVSDPTANKVMKRIELEQCFEDGKVTSGIITDSFDLEQIATGMKEWYLMKLEYEAICGFIGMLDKEDREIFVAYIKKEKSVDDIAARLCIERDSATKRLYRIRKMIFDEALPWFKEYK